MNFYNPTLTPATANARVRALWITFERSQAKNRAQLDIAVRVALEKAEATWNKAPYNDRMSRSKHIATKTRIAKGIKTSYFEKARAKWDDKLERAGLKAEYWTDFTEDERRRITLNLGSDDESVEELVVVVPPAPITQPIQPPFFHPMAPSFSTSSRATNFSSSSYAFVNPSEFNSEEEDYFEIPFSNPVATSVDLTSEDDDDAAFFIPSYPPTRPSLVGSGFSRASSLQASVSNPSKPQSARPLVSGFAYNAAPSGVVQINRPQGSENEGNTAPTKSRSPRQSYVGPSLDADDEPINEELEFEKFKMRTRIEKIAEFHEAAALAEISLSIEIYKVRKQLNNNKDEDAPRVLEHHKRMVQLQKEKEEERKAIVKSERARRQSDLGRRLTKRDVKELPMSTHAFKTWGLSSCQEEINLPSRFNLDNLLSYDHTKIDVENLLNDMFPDDHQPYPGPEVSVASLFNSYSSTSSSQDAFRSSPSIHHTQEQLRQSPPPMIWNKPQLNSSPKPPRKTYLSPFGQSSDEAAVRNSNDGWGIDEPDVKSMTIWDNKPNSPTPAVAGAWRSKHVRTTSASSARSSKEATAPISQPPQGSSILSNNSNSFFITDDIEPEPTATPNMNSKAVKRKKPWVSTSDKSPSTIQTTTSSSQTSAAAKPPAISPTPAPASIPAPTPAPAPVGKKQNKKQRQANKKEGTVATPAAVAVTAIPVQEPETEIVLSQRESPKLETPAPVPHPVSLGSEHTFWLPKMVPAMTHAKMDSESTTPSFTWDDVVTTPRPAPKIPAHVQEAVKSQGTPRPNMLKKHINLMAEGFGATSSRTTLEQMRPAPIAKGPVWSSAPSPAPSLWGKTKADFETPKVVQQPVGSDFWVPGGFADKYNDEGVGGGGGGGDEDIGVGEWEPITTRSKQIEKAAPIPAKQQQSSIAAQPLRQVLQAASSSAPRVLGTKDLSDIAQPAPATVNSNSKKPRGKKNGKGKQRATVEEVSDEEKDNIDILPEHSNFIMESKVILEPKPSVPPGVYSSIIDFTDNDDVNDNNGYSSGFSGLTTSTVSTSSDNIFSSESYSSNAFNTQGVNASVGADWGATGGKHARWTPSVREESGSPSFSASFGSHLQVEPSIQETPIWGQPKPSAKNKGKGKRVV